MPITGIIFQKEMGILGGGGLFIFPESHKKAVLSLLHNVTGLIIPSVRLQCYLDRIVLHVFGFVRNNMRVDSKSVVWIVGKLLKKLIDLSRRGVDIE